MLLGGANGIEHFNVCRTSTGILEFELFSYRQSYRHEAYTALPLRFKPVLRPPQPSVLSGREYPQPATRKYVRLTSLPAEDNDQT